MCPGPVLITWETRLYSSNSQQHLQILNSGRVDGLGQENSPYGKLLDEIVLLWYCRQCALQKIDKLWFIQVLESSFLYQTCVRHRHYMIVLYHIFVKNPKGRFDGLLYPLNDFSAFTVDLNTSIDYKAHYMHFTLTVTHTNNPSSISMHVRAC